MKTLFFLKNPMPGWIWQKEDCLGDMEFRSVVGRRIKPKVNDRGTTTYFFDGEILQDGAYIVEVERGIYKHYPPDAGDRRFVR